MKVKDMEEGGVLIHEGVPIEKSSVALFEECWEDVIPLGQVPFFRVLPDNKLQWFLVAEDDEVAQRAFDELNTIGYNILQEVYFNAEEKDCKKDLSEMIIAEATQFLEANYRKQDRFVEVRKHINETIIQKHEMLGIEEKPSVIEVPPQAILQEIPLKAFISHGKNTAALKKLTEFIETLGIEPLIVKKRASLDKDLPDKVDTYINQADFVIILATADDKVEDRLQPRQNVIHEIGLAQKTHPGRIIYLLEEGAGFPSNIRPKVWESFKQRNVMDAFLGIIRELRA